MLIAEHVDGKAVRFPNGIGMPMRQTGGYWYASSHLIRIYSTTCTTGKVTRVT